MKNKLTQGFTLIELMVVVAIVGVLAAVAYPAYREHIARSRRAQAITVLTSAQQWMERFYTENFRYDKNSSGVAVTHPSQFPSRFSVAPPADQGSPVYNIAVVVTNNVRDAYSVTATRRPGSAMENDRCGDFSLDHLGRKDLKNYSGFADKKTAIQTCWK